MMTYIYILTILNAGSSRKMVSIVNTYNFWHIKDFKNWDTKHWKEETWIFCLHLNIHKIFIYWQSVTKRLIRTNTFSEKPNPGLYHVWPLLVWGSWVVSAVDLNQFNTGTNPVPTETFTKYGRIYHLWVINPLKSQ